MKKNLLTLLCLITFSLTQGQNVPNGGFENWTSGEPDNWLTTNIFGFGTAVTQETPAFAGSFAVRGTVINSIGGPIPPFVASTDMAGNGFAITQAYSTFSFTYKTSVTGNAKFIASVIMNDALDSTVGVGGAIISGTVSTYTSVSVPITYTGSNPTTCVIVFQVADTSGASVPLGNYFVVDAVGLSGVASVHENVSSVNIANVYPNPASHVSSVQYSLASKTDVQFQVVNTQGKTVREILLPEQGAGKHQTDFDVSALPAGFYFVRMKTKDGITFSTLQVAR